MKPRLTELLTCPLDRTPLELVEWESTPVTLDDSQRARIRRMGALEEGFAREIETGLLVNRARRTYYPIVRGVPRLLVFPAGVVRDFAERHRERLDRELPGFSPPAQAGTPGEEEILRTFSTEWLEYEWNEQAYWGQSAEETLRAMHFALDLDRKQLRDRLVLEVGIGVGGTADYITRTQEGEVVGTDLSYAADAAYKAFGKNSFLHIVQSSAFASPFREGQFEFVYTHGVLHHTFSTHAAFEAISRLPRVGGRLYVWVYNPADEQRTLIRRALMGAETVLRPIYSRLPDQVQTAALAPWAPLYMVHQKLRALKDRIYVAYGWREAMHAARDRFTHRFVHRHTYEEVCGWFEQAGYRDLDCMNRRQVPADLPFANSVSTAVEGIRAQ